MEPIDYSSGTSLISYIARTSQINGVVELAAATSGVLTCVPPGDPYRRAPCHATGAVAPDGARTTVDARGVQDLFLGTFDERIGRG